MAFLSACSGIRRADRMQRGSGGEALYLMPVESVLIRIWDQTGKPTEGWYLCREWGPRNLWRSEAIERCIKVETFGLIKHRPAIEPVSMGLMCRRASLTEGKTGQMPWGPEEGYPLVRRGRLMVGRESVVLEAVNVLCCQLWDAGTL